VPAFVPDQGPASAPHPRQVDVQSPPHALPLAINDEDLPPLERARHLVVKAKSYLVQARTSEAARALEQAVKLDDHSSASFEAWLLLGKLRTANPAWSTRAIEALKMASQIKPKSAQPWALMGELYHRKGFWDNAQACYNRAWALDPSIEIPYQYQDMDQMVMRPKGPVEGHTSLVGRMKSMFGREKNARS
jgi:tetratricopeptide (TPR) repeat protein